MTRQMIRASEYSQCTLAVGWGNRSYEKVSHLFRLDGNCAHLE